MIYQVKDDYNRVWEFECYDPRWKIKNFVVVYTRILPNHLEVGEDGLFADTTYPKPVEIHPGNLLFDNPKDDKLAFAKLCKKWLNEYPNKYGHVC